MKAKFLRTAFLIVPAMLLAACGGGDGGGGGGAAPASTAAGVVITSANASAVAAEAVEVSTNTDAAAAGAGFVTGVQVGGSGSADTLLLANAARKLLAKGAGATTLATGAATTEACTGGGTITLDVTTSGGAALAAGDSFRISANNCTESDGTTSMVMNGSMTLSIVSGSYDPASPVYPKSVTMRMVTSNFSVSSGGQSEVFNGDLTIALTENSATSVSVTLTATSLASTIGSHSVTVSNYTLSFKEDANGSTGSITATVQTNNTRLGSSPVSYTITTVTPVSMSPTGALTGGSIKVTGSGSALLLTVTSADTFTLQVDTNGDGTYDSSSSVTRSQMQALL